MLFLICCGISTAWANSPLPADVEFEIKGEQLRKRYQDFYILLNEEDRREVERQRYADEVRAERKAKAEARERARQEHIKNRKEKPIVTQEEHLREIQEQKAAHEKARRDYQTRQEQLRALEKKVGVIPDWVEYELYPAYEVTD